MGSERLPPLLAPAQQGVADALERAIPFAGHDAEERAERHELRKIEIKEAVRA